MATYTVKNGDFETKVLQNKLPVLVDFWAEWCGPCKVAEPVLEELSEKYREKVEIAKVNVDENQQISMKYGVMSIPTTVLFVSGKEVGRQVGFAGKKAYEDLMNKGL